MMTIATRSSQRRGRQGSSAARPPVVRVITAVLTAFTAWHLVASFLWIAPPTPLRTLIPGDTLTAYMIPLFGQSWSVFAPEPINGDLILDVRAEVPAADGDDDKGSATEWVDATAVELSMSRHNLFPPRAANLATQQAMEYKNAFDALNGDQKRVVSYGYYKDGDWSERLESSLVALGDTPAVHTYIAKEQSTRAYATQVAQAIWGDDVMHVQFQVSRQNVVPFFDRHDPDVVPPALQVVSTGWRGIETLPDQNAEQFADVFLKAQQNLENER